MQIQILILEFIDMIQKPMVDKYKGKKTNVYK